MPARQRVRPVQCRHLRLGAERQPLKTELVQEAPQGPDIRRLTNRSPPENVPHLRRPVRRGSVLSDIRLSPRPFHRRVHHQFSHHDAAKVAELPDPIRREQQILGFHVAVNERRRLRVHVTHRARTRGEGLEHLLFRHSRLRFDVCVDVLRQRPLAQLHHEQGLHEAPVRSMRFGPRDIPGDQGDDVWMVREASVEVSLALGLALSVLSVRRNQHLLHRHPRTRAELPRLVHPRHASLGEHLLHEPVTPGDREGCPAQVAGSAARGGGTLLCAAGEPNVLERLAHAVEHGDSTRHRPSSGTLRSRGLRSPRKVRDTFWHRGAPPGVAVGTSPRSRTRVCRASTERRRGTRSFRSGHARAPARGPLRFGQQRP